MIGDVERTHWIVPATVGMVLLIACANVANLFLVRAEGRQNELAVRTALGASRGRMAQELLTESLMLALVAGVVGLLFARAGLAPLKTLAPSILPRIDEIAIDPVVLLFTLASRPCGPSTPTCHSPTYEPWTTSRPAQWRRPRSPWSC